LLLSRLHLISNFFKIEDILFDDRRFKPMDISTFSNLSTYRNSN